MKVRFLRDFGGDNTLGVFYLEGAVVDLPKANVIGLLRRGGVVELLPDVVKVAEVEEEPVPLAGLPAVAKAKGRK